MLDDLTENFSSLLFSPALSVGASALLELLLLLLLLEFDKLRGKILRGSVKDELLEDGGVLEIKLACGGIPKTVFINRALLKLDIN